MEEKEIIEGNGLIAKFHGWCHIPTPKGKGKGYWDFPEWGIAQWDAGSFEYHSSWDWIMPVVEKIEAIHHIWEGHYLSIEITQGYIKVHGTRQTMIRNVSVEGSKIKAVWLACIDFIKWYNTLSK